MQINRDIVNRALEAAGQERLNEKDIETQSTRWRLIKDSYLSLILSTLSKTAWTSRITRAELTEAEGGNLTNYAYKYRLPADCAKPESLKDNTEYITEGDYLYTDTPGAILVYVSNGFVGKRYTETPVTEKTFPEGVFYFFDEETEEYIQADEYDSDKTYYSVIEDDYPEYDNIRYDPALSEYLEYALASKIAIKITGDQNLATYLFNQALITEDRAKKATLEAAHSKEQGEPFWGDLLGLSVEGRVNDNN